ncbi:MAG: glutathione S-transferase family protein [Cyanobacteriota bacterium]|nr:glutathione S-transferase family protein [Cyanobacteriota bacterium]
MPTLELYSAVVCPYAHRTRLVLLEKKIPFDLHEIDLQNKPPHFHEISPYGKVPAIKQGEERVWESAIINEYLDEVFPDPPLLPTDPLKKAQARIWIDFANTRFVPAFSQLLRSQDPEAQALAAQELTNHLLFIEKEGLSKLSEQGPYWFGSELSLVDLTFYPWFERWPALTYYRDFYIPEELSQLHLWWQALSQRQSIQSIANPQDYYIERYARFANPLPTSSH